MELGGYFEFEHSFGEEYYTDLLRFNTVRNAIVFVIQEKKYTKIWIPRYLCDCIQKVFLKNHIAFDFYSLNADLSPNLSRKLLSHEAILIINYYGKFNNTQLEKFQDKYTNIIVDNTQSFFQRPSPKIDTVYTCRKYFGVPDGAYLYLTQTSVRYESLPVDCSRDRMTHLLGRFEKNASDYYLDFCRIDKSFENEDIKKMSLLTQNLLRFIDYKKIIEIRSSNFKEIDSLLSKYNEYSAINDGGLYMYPFLTTAGAFIKSELIQNKIYIPTLWPNVLDECPSDSYEYYLANNLVLLPLDQRYGPNAIQYMLSVLNPILRKVGIKK